jgi:methionine sulfoxide reductase heme-binding subunit
MRAWIWRKTFSTMTIKNVDHQTIAWLKAAVFLTALLPLAKFGWNAIQHGLGANPIEKITRTTGYWALTMLMLSLAITPLRHISGWQWLVRLRRMLGLFAFFYASLHFLCYIVLDQFFDWDGIAKDIIKRPYITVGFPAFVLLIPLAITSTDNMIRKLGGKHWKSLHKLVYLSAIVAVVHYWWLVKKDLSNPIAFAIILVLLLGFRLITFCLRRLRKRMTVVNTNPIQNNS